jgi:hypothetical protein
MGATATAAGGMLMPGTSPIVAESQVASMTDHFWYRLQPEGPYIDSQRDNKAFGFDDATIFLSEDNARTWPHSVSFADARNITFSAIMKNGNVIFATGSRLYLSTDNLKTYHPITVKDAGGADYIPHKPQNPELPGWYFHPLDGVHTWDVNGVEMLVWGNYCNVLGGASPVNIYYSVDGGRTVRIAYAFGQNPGYRDNGSEGGGSTGTPLGDPDNPVIARHIHCVAYNPAENAFYACTGDRDRDGKQECHWLRGAYDAGNDKWRWTVLVSGPSNSRYKSGALLGSRRQRSHAARPGNLSVRPGRPGQARGPHDALQPAIRSRKHDHPGRRDSVLPLRPGIAILHGHYHLPGHGPDMGAVRSKAVRPAISGPIRQKEHRRLVPNRLEIRMDQACRGVVHQAKENLQSRIGCPRFLPYASSSTNARMKKGLATPQRASPERFSMQCST